jgi:hypothetical protein
MNKVADKLTTQSSKHTIRKTSSQTKLYSEQNKIKMKKKEKDFSVHTS